MSSLQEDECQGEFGNFGKRLSGGKVTRDELCSSFGWFVSLVCVLFGFLKRTSAFCLMKLLCFFIMYDNDIYINFQLPFTLETVL